MTALANLVLLALVYAVIGFGLVFIVRWAARELPGGLTASLSVLTRAMPLLLVFSLVLFINTEMWQVFSLMPRAYLAAAALLLALVTTSFLFGRLPREVLGSAGRRRPAAEPRASASTSASSCSSRRRCRCWSSAPAWRSSSSSSAR